MKQRVLFKLSVNNVMREIREGDGACDISAHFEGSPAELFVRSFGDEVMVSSFPERQELLRIAEAVEQQTTDAFSRKICPLCRGRNREHLPDCAGRMAAEWMERRRRHEHA